MLRNRRLLLIGLLLLATVCLVLVVLALLPPHSGVTKENFDRIKVGMMMLRQVILGGPPSVGWGKWGHDEWESDENNTSIAIQFDNDGVVADKMWLGLPDERTAFDKLLDRLPWRKKPPRRVIFVD